MARTVPDSLVSSALAPLFLSITALSTPDDVHFPKKKTPRNPSATSYRMAKSTITGRNQGLHH
jgi:hypothetical protein